MDRPVLLVAVNAVALACPGVMLAQQTAADAGTPHSGRVSSYVRQALNDATARLPLPPPTPNEPPTSAASAARHRVTTEDPDMRARPIVKMPEFIVREPRLPSSVDVMTPQELARHAVRKYYGDQHEFWGRIDLGAVWAKIPILSRILPLMTLEQRATEKYHDDRKRERWSDAMGLLSPAERERVLHHPERPAPWK